MYIQWKVLSHTKEWNLKDTCYGPKMGLGNFMLNLVKEARHRGISTLSLHFYKVLYWISSQDRKWHGDSRKEGGVTVCWAQFAGGDERVLGINSGDGYSTLRMD